MTGQCGSCGGNYLGNGESGYCELKTCLARTPDSGATFVCGSSDCFYDQGTERCTVTCSAQSHYTEDLSSGTCVMRSCAERTRNASAVAQCGGSGCYYNDVEKTCVLVCPRESHYKEDTDSLQCVLKTCEERAVNTSAQTPCGPGADRKSVV